MLKTYETKHKNSNFRLLKGCYVKNLQYIFIMNTD